MNPIFDLISGVVSGILKPLVGAYTAHLDTTLEAFKAGTDADRANYAAYADYALKLQQVKIASMNWIGPKIAYMIIAIPVSLHLALVYVDSTFTHGHLSILALPGKYADFEQMVAGSLFVTSLVQAPLNAVTQWFHGKQP